MSFEKWLIEQKGRNDGIGDLAEDFINTNCVTIEESFEKFSPCDAALEAYRDARAEFEGG